MTDKPLRICAITGSRADWGYLKMPLLMLRDCPTLELRLVATGQHLTPHSGGSLQVIKEDGFEIDARVDMQLAGDTAKEITKSLGLAVIGFADVLERLNPDLLFVLGDRYEILAAVQAALMARIPVAHISGGDLTEGAMDESIRHAITKMSHIHFVTNKESERRVRQLGEDPSQVHLVGSPGLDSMRSTPRMERSEFFQFVGLTPRDRNLLITFHPVTLDMDSEMHCAEMLAALDSLGPDVGLIFTGTNYDTSGRRIESVVRAFAESRANAVIHASLGPIGYFSALSHVHIVVGNSSSGILEAPSFGTPTVNIGDRQRGRLRSPSVIDCCPERSSIRAAIDQAFAMDCSGLTNPYGDGHASERIAAVLMGIENPRKLLKKRFHTVGDGFA